MAAPTIAASGSAGRPAPRAGLELWGSLAVLLLAAFALLGDALSSRRVLSQADALLAFEPWKSAAPADYAPANPLLLDQSTVCEPWMQLAAAQLRSGELPLWNPYNYCGQPYHAAASGGFASPLNWLYFVFPGHGTWEWLALLRLFLAGAFTLLWLRNFELSPFARLLGALCFQLGGFMVAWLGHPHTAAAVFLPFLLWRSERALRDSPWSACGWIGLGAGMTWLSGHAQTALHIALYVSLYGTWRGAQMGRAWRMAGVLGTGQLLGLVIGLPQLLPFAEYLRGSQAAVLFARLDVTSPLELGRAALFLIHPSHYGTPQGGDYAGPIGHNLNYAELVGGYVGVLPLLLALFALRRWRATPPVRVLTLAALLALLVAWQVPPFYEAARSVPVLASTKLLRLLLCANISLAGLAAFGLDRALDLARLDGRRRSCAAAAALALASLDLWATGVNFNPSIAPERIAPTSAITRFLAADPALFRVLAVDNTVLLPNANVFHRIAMVSGYDSLEDKRLVGLVSLLSQDPAAVLRDLRPALPPSELPNTSFIKEIRAFDRSDAFAVATLLNVKYVLSRDALPAPLALCLDGPLKVYANPGVLPRAYATTAYRWVEPQRDDDATWLHADRAHIPDPLRVELERPDGVAPAPAADREPELQSCEIIAYEARRVEIAVRAERECCVVLSDTWAPGWSATLDGVPVPILRAHRALRGVLSPAGSHRIEMRYAPESARRGMLAGIAGTLAALASIALGRSRSGAGGVRT
jgi:hypothetical protein